MGLRGGDNAIETWGLLKKKTVGVLEAFCPRGATFPRHVHQEIVILVIYDGEMEIEYNGAKLRLGPGETITFLPGEPHAVRYLTDCLIIAVSIPAAKEFPNA